uniref:Uncharacterized protein n=1 Tax=Plectus sambesii TaxID=2011161 RepID=A0A914W9I6_9BILA
MIESSEEEILSNSNDSNNEKKKRRHRSSVRKPPIKRRSSYTATGAVGEDEFHAYIKVLLSHVLDRKLLQKIATRETAFDVENMRALEVVDDKNQKLMKFIKAKGRMADEIADICQRHNVRVQIAVKPSTNNVDLSTMKPKCMQCHLSNSKPSSVRWKYIFEGFQYDKETLLYKDGDCAHPMCQIATLKCSYEELTDDQLVNRASSDKGWISGITSKFLQVYRKIEEKRD